MTSEEHNKDEKNDSLELRFAPEEKFANPRDHMGRTALDVKSLCGKHADCRCPECNHKLILRSGEKTATHFAHAAGRADRSCKGGFETPWHKCAKWAAGLREGWMHEFTDKTARYSRFDAYNQFTKEAFEAVHSLSNSYLEKQSSLASLGIDCTWLFDSAGDFANRNQLPLDIEKATKGLLECSDLLKPKAIQIILHIGAQRCFLHYLGLAWKWVGVDRWQVCTPFSPVQQLCISERGINRLLIDMRARGDMPKDKLAFRNGELVSTSWTEITPQYVLQKVLLRKEQLLESWRRTKKAREASRRRKAVKQYRPATQTDVLYKARPVCELSAERVRLSRQLDDYNPEFSNVTRQNKADAVDLGTLRLLYNSCAVYGHTPIGTKKDFRGWVRFECERCGKFLGYAPQVCIATGAANGR
jgi:hypothetical protein